MLEINSVLNTTSYQTADDAHAGNIVTPEINKN